MTWLRSLFAGMNPKWVSWLAALLSSIVTAIIMSFITGTTVSPVIPPPPLAQAPEGANPIAGDFGWVNNPEAVAASVKAIEARQGYPADFGRIAKDAIRLDTDEPVFLWDAEQKVLKKVLDSWDQGQIGSCVSHGWGRAVQDLLLIQIASKGDQDWPGAEVCREAIYGGSRVQIGGGKIGGDGSVGAWAADWVQKFGTIFYLKYDGFDLTNGYSVSRCKQWGDQGCPKALEATAKEHPVLGIAKVSSSSDVWAALGSGYPVPICSDVGFDSPLKDGFCARRGSWGHCMEVRARFLHPTKGKCFVIQNSWGDYLKSSGNSNSLVDVQGRGKVQLPMGCFAVTSNDIDVIVRQGDSFAISNVKGFPKTVIDWSARANPDWWPGPKVVDEQIWAEIDREFKWMVRQPGVIPIVPVPAIVPRQIDFLIREPQYALAP